MTAIIAGVIGAGVGALFTVFGTWGVTVLLDRQRENRQLINAIGIICAELQENADRLASGKVPAQLTLGDWKQIKPILAGLGLRPDSATHWKRALHIYRTIYEAQRGGNGKLTAEALLALHDDLGDHAEQLKCETRLIPFAKLLERRYSFPSAHNPGTQSDSSE
jgi:hypothetical protein